jgi:hypothetical protein
MIQKTTPTLQFSVTGFDLTGYDVYIYISQPGVNFTIENPDVVVTNGNSAVSCQLSAMQTLALGTGTAFAQIWATKDGDSVASAALPFSVGRIFNRGIPA